MPCESHNIQLDFTPCVSFKTNTGKFMIERQTAVELNMLPTSLLRATTLKRFEIDLKKHILSNIA